MAEQSHRDEMSAAIRAQRERKATPRSIAPDPGPSPAPDRADEPPAPEPARKRRFARLRNK
jgi:hypothetical protein